MDKVQILQYVADTWTITSTTWDGVLQEQKSVQAQLIFTSTKAIANAEHGLRSRILSKFGIQTFLFSQVCLESNGFSGCEPILDQNGKLEYYNHWSRFSIKQTTKELRPKGSFTPHHPTWGTLELEDNLLPSHKPPLHDARSIPYGWEWYEMGFFTHWTSSYSTTILCFDLPEQLQISLQSALIHNAKTDFSDPYSIFLVILYELLALYDNSVWSIRDHICNWEVTRPQEPDYPLLHEMARHAIHVSETLMVTSKTVQDIQQHQQSFVAAQSQNNYLWNTVQNRLQFQLRIIQTFLSRSESNKARIQNEITLAFHTAAQCDSKIQVQIGEQAMKETSTMKVIAYITMTFLPATFVSSVFSMSFFHFEPGQNGIKGSFTVSDKFWMYWVLAAPLSLVVLGLWYFGDGTWAKKRRNTTKV